MAETMTRLWPEVDRVALCIHRPSGRDPGFRALVDRLGIPAGSMLVSAARHLAAGRVTLTDLELLSRYESRSLVAANAQRHVDAGLLDVVVAGEFVPSLPFRNAARTVLEIQAHAANSLWLEVAGAVDELGELASAIVAAIERPVPTPAFDAQVAHHHVVPGGVASTVLAHVTELRYLRADLHAHALGDVGFAGPRARALTRIWNGHPVSDDDGRALAARGLAVAAPGGWRLTDTARAARDHAERVTDELTERATTKVAHADLARALRLLRTLPGVDPRALADR